MTKLQSAVYDHVIIVNVALRAGNEAWVCQSFILLALLCKLDAGICFCSFLSVAINLFHLLLKVVCTISNMHEFIDEFPFSFVFWIQVEEDVPILELFEGRLLCCCECQLLNIFEV